MSLLRWFAGRWLIRRLFGGAGTNTPHRRSPAYLRSSRRRQPRGGRVGLFGPVPYYSARTRRGTRVSVGGCCLPIPLALAASVLAGTRLLVTRRA